MHTENANTTIHSVAGPAWAAHTIIYIESLQYAKTVVLALLALGCRVPLIERIVYLH